MQLTSHYTVQKMADEKLAMSIPIFQRLFVWEEEQTRQLLEDLKKASKEHGDSPYYIGVITVQKDTRNGNLWKIVDGQQRLTFLTLIAAEMGWNDFVFMDLKKEALRINYIGRSEDEDDIRFLAAKQNEKVANVNFQRFHSVYQEFSTKPDYDKEAFSTYVKEQCAFLVSELPANYKALDLNLFFEKMNSTGRQLTPVEVIKGKYFAKYANTWNKVMNFEKPCELFSPLNDHEIIQQQTLGDLWNNMKEFAVPGPDEDQLHLERLVMRPEVLLLHVLKMTLNEEVAKDLSLDYMQLVQTFRENEAVLNVTEHGESFPEREKFMQNLVAYRQWLDKNVIYLHNNGDSYEYVFRDGDDEKDAHRKLKQYQAMLYVSSGDTQTWVLDYYKKMKHAQLLDMTEKLDILKRLDREKRPLPALDGMRYGQIDRYWFWALDYILWEKATDGTLENDFPQLKDDLLAIRKYTFRRNRSIEHLHPQNPPEGQETDDWFKDRNENSNSVRDGFGNLAMISASFNSTQSNDSVGVKFARVKDIQLPNKNLESSKMLLMFRVAGGEDKNWTPGVAKTHGEAMYKLLETAYKNSSSSQE